MSGTFNILVPLDFSELSYKALDAAKTMAGLLGGKITPFHAYIPISDVDGLYFYGMGAAAQTTFNDVEPAIKERLETVALERVDASMLNPPLAGVGSPAHAIAEAATDFDMLVISSHGRTGVSRFFLGSTAEKVVRTCSVPVLVVEEESHLTPLNRMLVTTDFSENSKAAFPAAVQVAKATGARIDFVNIFKYDAFQ